MQEILDKLTEVLTNERLDNIIQEDLNYQDVSERLDTAFKKLEQYYEEAEDEELKDIVDSYDTISHEESALHIKLAYQQGMKDVAQFILSLI